MPGFPYDAWPIGRNGRMVIAATDKLEPDACDIQRTPCCKRGPLEVWPLLDSTNAELLRRGMGQDRTVLIADAQSAGRGRLGRVWISPPGTNLYLSMLLRHPRGAAFAPSLSLALGVAACEALHQAGVSQARLKWPNDLVAEGRKLGGILVEGTSGLAGVVAGIGINLGSDPELARNVGQPVACVADFTVPPSRDALAAAVIAAWNSAVDEFIAHGLAAFLDRWRALDAFAQSPVRVVSGGMTFDGVAQGVDAQGRLLLEVDGTLRAFASAETSLCPA